MLSARSLAPVFALFALTASAQSPAPLVRVFHPAPPLFTYEVATIKPFDQSLLNRPGAFISKDTVRELIRNAYSTNTSYLPASQVLGGPDWIDRDEYTVTGKPSPELEVARRNMTIAARALQDHAMQQSLLASRFDLKVHFEVRELPVYALVPANSGLKLKQVAPPPPHDFSAPPQTPDQPLAPETANIGTTANGTDYIHARAIPMARLITILSSNLQQTGSRPIADETGFTGYFDIDDLRWANSESANAGAASEAPSLETALEKTLGLRLILTKGPVEVVVIDSIDHPSKN